MKKILFVFMVIVFSSQLFAQPTTPSQPLTKQDYMRKSKSQKTVGFVLLGIGVACIAIAAPGDVALNTAPILIIGGGAAALVSIPLFISAKKNKRRAMSMTTSLDANKIPNVSSSGILYSSYPALSLKIKL